MVDVREAEEPVDETELAIEGALRPSSLAEFVGQQKVRAVSASNGAFEYDFDSPPMTSLHTDGRALYYWSQDGLGNGRAIYRSNLDGTAMTKLAGNLPFPEGPPAFGGSFVYYPYRPSGALPFELRLAKAPKTGASWSPLTDLVTEPFVVADDVSVYFHAFDLTTSATPFFARAAR